MSEALPRVGVLTSGLSSAAGGVFFAVRDAANLLEARGLSQAVFGLRDAAFERDRAQWHVSSLQAFDGAGPASFRISPALLRALAAARLDVLHLHGIWNFASLAGYLWRKRTRLPLLVSPHGMLDPGALAFSAAKKRLVAALYERANLQGAAAIHALTVAEADGIRAFGIAAPIAIIRNGVDLPAAAVLSARDWSGGQRRTMLFLARLHPKKGVEQLIAAWRLMLDRAPELAARWRLTLAGWDDGGALEQARRQIAALDLGDHVDLPGALFGEAKHDALTRAHAFILPSRSEGLPITVLEAWAYGLPVFMTAACNLPGGFAADAAVRIEPAAGPIAMVLAEQLARDDDTLRAMGLRGRALVARDFTWDRVVEDYRALYLWLAGRAPRPGFVRLAAGDRST